MAQSALSQLKEELNRRFNINELRDLSFALSVDYEEFPVEKSGLVREFILYLQRNGRLLELVQHLQDLRPEVGWDALAAVAAIEAEADLLPLTTSVPFHVPNLPDHFVVRPQAGDPIKKRLLSEPENGRFVTAIHDMGGSGKSTLAAALARDEGVRRRFPDGVLWVTLGQEIEEATILAKLGEQIQHLGDFQFKPATIEGAAQRLDRLLADKALLLVVDDAWQPDHAAWFLVGGPRCHVLITTREGLVAQQASDVYELGEMTPGQAVDLFQKRLGRELVEEEKPLAGKVAAEVGYLPLALELAAAQVREDSASWQELLADLQTEVARLETLEGLEAEEVSTPELRKRLSLRASFTLSLRRLPAKRLEQFAWLGVLPEDVLLTDAAAATIWATRAREARQVLGYLRGKSLVRGGDTQAGDRAAYQLHDLALYTARNVLTAPKQPVVEEDLPGLGLTLQEANATLLERYFGQTADGLWHTLPEDGYIQGHLTWHMQKAGKDEMIHALLREVNAAGRNGWYMAQEGLGRTADYLADVTQAWRLAEADPPDIGRQCRYALITASLNSLAANLPPQLPALLLEEGLWKPEQALAYVRQVPDLQSRSAVLIALAPHLPEGVYEAAGTIGDERSRAEVLAALAPHVPERVYKAAGIIGDERSRAEVLVALAPHLPAAEQAEALKQALEATLKIEKEWYRVEVLTALAPHLPGAEKAEALKQAQGALLYIDNDKLWASASAAVAPHLPGAEKAEALKRALAAARAIGAEEPRARILAALAPHLPEPVYEAAGAIRDEEHRAKVLMSLAPHLPGAVYEAAVVIGDERSRAEVLTAVAPHLSRAGHVEALEQALAAAQTISDEEPRAKVLTTMVPFLPGAERDKALRQALEATQGIRDEWHRVWSLKDLSPHLPEMVYEAAWAIGDMRPRAEVLTTVAPHLPGMQRDEALRQALQAALGIRDEGERASALAAVAPHLPELVYEAVQAISDKRDRARILIALAPHLPGADRDEALRQALQAAQGIRYEGYRVWSLTDLSPHLPELVYEAAQAISDEESRAKVLSVVALHLPGADRDEALRQALEAALGIRDEWDRAEVLTTVALHLPGTDRDEALRQALQVAQGIRNEWDRARVLSAVAPHLPELVYEAALGIRDEGSRAWTLRALAPHLPEPVYEAALGIRIEWYREQVLSAVAPHLPEPVYEAALGIRDEGSRAKVLTNVAPHLLVAQRDEVLRQALEGAIGSGWSQTEILTALAPHLPGPLQEALYPLWRQALPIMASRARKDLLSDLAALLPVIEALGGQEALSEMTQAVLDVGRWWP